MATGPIRAIIFDFDGLMVETEAPAYQVTREVFAAHGVDLPLELWVRIIGGSGGTGSSGQGIDVYDHLEAQLGRAVYRDALWAEARERHHHMVERQPLLPGVAGYIAAAGAMGLQMAVASSSSRQWVAGHLEQRGLLGHFGVVVTRDEVPRTKPEPDLFLAALAGLGLAPDQAIALEDSPRPRRPAAGVTG